MELIWMLEDEVNPGQKLVSAVERCRVWNRLFVGECVLQFQLDIWTSEDLESGGEGIARVIARYPIGMIGGGIHAEIGRAHV